MSTRLPAHWGALAICMVALGLLTSGCGDSGGDTSSASEESAPREEGGEKSIENFGEKASADDESAILGVFTDHLNALAQEDNVTACAHLSANVHQALKQIAGSKGKSLTCEQILPKLLTPTAPAIARAEVNGEVKRVRVGGDRAFVVFHAPGAKLYVLGLTREGGEWKATTVIPSVLVPEL